MIDTQLFYLINHLPHSTAADIAALSIHLLTRTGLIYVPLLAGLLISRKPHNYHLAKFGTIAAVSAYLINDQVLKNIFGRLRPFQTLSDVYFISPSPENYSMPSGQTAVAFAIATAIWLAYPKRWFSYAMFIFAAIVALSRIYMGQHYPTDILVGMIVGGLCTFASYKILKRKETNA